MGQFCYKSACCQQYLGWKALRDMNKKGVYTPVQISEHIDKYWDKLDIQSDTANNKLR